MIRKPIRISNMKNAPTNTGVWSEHDATMWIENSQINIMDSKSKKNLSQLLISSGGEAIPIPLWNKLRLVSDTHNIIIEKIDIIDNGEIVDSEYEIRFISNEINDDRMIGQKFARIVDKDSYNNFDIDLDNYLNDYYINVNVAEAIPEQSILSAYLNIINYSKQKHTKNIIISNHSATYAPIEIYIKSPYIRNSQLSSGEYGMVFKVDPGCILKLEVSEYGYHPDIDEFVSYTHMLSNNYIDVLHLPDGFGKCIVGIFGLYEDNVNDVATVKLADNSIVTLTNENNIYYKFFDFDNKPKSILIDATLHESIYRVVCDGVVLPLPTEPNADNKWEILLPDSDYEPNENVLVITEYNSIDLTVHNEVGESDYGIFISGSIMNPSYPTAH